jgi:dipeptidyl aminopeptidase/acylaminoacyl peptidase
MTARIPGTVLAILATVAAAASPASARPLAPEDQYSVRDISEARLSPDGAWVAYTVTRDDADLDEETSDIWMSRVDGSASVQLTNTPESEYAPRWSPDGSKLAFLSDRGTDDDNARIWILDMRGGEARVLDGPTNSVSDFAFSPDGKRIVYVAEVDPNETGGDKPQPIVIDRYYFKEDITGYLHGQRSHLFLLDIADGKSKQLTFGDFDDMQPAFSPDGKRIAFVSKRVGDPDRHNNWDIYAMDVEPGAAVERVTKNPGMDGDPSTASDGGWGSGAPDWSPDGSRIAYLHGGAPEDIWYGLLQVAVIGSLGANDTLPTEGLDRNTLRPRWSADGRSLYFMLEDDRSVQLAKVRLRDGRIDRLTAPGNVVYEFDVGKDDRVVYVSSNPQAPAEIWTLDRGKPRRITTQNDDWLADVDLLPAEPLAAKSPDGLEIRGLYIDPRSDKSVPAPAILRIHGGPVGQFQYEFDFEWQMFAAAGYVVAGVNPRGSSGRGFEFQKMLFAKWGYVDVPDILGAADQLVAAGIADPDRMGVGGWSYGAILTNYVVASTDRFKAATSGAGMSDMLGGYGIDEYVREWELELGKPWKNTDLWIKLSYPFLHADRITTPTLFMCGSADFNVPLPASEQMYEALRSVGVPTRLVIYPDQNHGFVRPSFILDKRKRYLDWYTRYVKH